MRAYDMHFQYINCYFLNTDTSYVSKVIALMEISIWYRICHFFIIITHHPPHSSSSQLIIISHNHEGHHHHYTCHHLPHHHHYHIHHYNHHHNLHSQRSPVEKSGELITFLSIRKWQRPLKDKDFFYTLWVINIGNKVLPSNGTSLFYGINYIVRIDFGIPN